uniref:Uncharacterized protein n=1 Tax=Cucumis melo TaxID=3656 RepID=A0A9I9CH46_CUCME
MTLAAGSVTEWTNRNVVRRQKPMVRERTKRTEAKNYRRGFVQTDERLNGSWSWTKCTIDR